MRILSKVAPIAAVMALASTPAWALPGGGHGSKGTPPASPGTKGAHGVNGHAEGKGHSGEGKGSSKGASGTDKHGNGKSKSQRCQPRSIAYVASGTLVSDTLTEGASHTYSGTVTVEVLHGNRHSRSDKGTQKVYTVEAAHLTLAVPDLDKDSIVAVDDLAAGDRVQLIGHITALAKGCPTNEFTPKLTIRKIVFHGPRHSSTSSATTTSTS